MTIAAQPFAGRTALITGATSGIGWATTLRILSGGARVIACGRRAARLDALAEAAATDRLRTIELDVTALSSVDALPSLLAPFPPDILVNNAGLALGLGPAQTASLDDWDRMIATNVSGLVHATRAVLPAMRNMPRADIIMLSSVAASHPYPGGNVYGATKAFVTQFALNLRADLVGTPVRVTSIEPGMTDTEFSLVRLAGDAARAAAVYARMTPLSADDIARVIADVLALPPHININRIELMPTDQAFGPFAVHRRDA